MLNLYEAEQLVKFEKVKSLNEVAEELHISAPTLTRTMKHLEEEFGVSLFTRTKNKISLNETGKLAAELCARLLEQENDTKSKVRDFDTSLKTISIFSCAPAPAWILAPIINDVYTGMTVSTKIEDFDQYRIPDLLKRYDIVIGTEETPYPIMNENLYLVVRKDHILAGRKEITAEELNGYNFLLRDGLGYWEAIVRKLMPDSKFMVQPDRDTFHELVANSIIPNFITNYNLDRGIMYPDRIAIPMTDPEVNVTFYMHFNDANKYEKLIKAIQNTKSI